MVLRDIKVFMTEEEQQQMNHLLDQVGKRMQEQQPNAYVFLKGQGEMYAQVSSDSCMSDMSACFEKICDCCRDRQGYCYCLAADEGEDPLPF